MTAAAGIRGRVTATPHHAKMRSRTFTLVMLVACATIANGMDPNGTPPQQRLSMRIADRRQVTLAVACKILYARQCGL